MSKFNLELKAHFLSCFHLNIQKQNFIFKLRLFSFFNVVVVKTRDIRKEIHPDPLKSEFYLRFYQFFNLCIQSQLRKVKLWNVETGTVMNMCSIIYRKIFQHFFNSFSKKKLQCLTIEFLFLDDSTEILIGFVCVRARIGHFNYALYYFYCCWWGGVTLLPLSPLYNDHLHRKRQTKQTILNNGHPYLNT